jgi:hypothetical protein
MERVKEERESSETSKSISHENIISREDRMSRLENNDLTSIGPSNKEKTTRAERYKDK